MITAHNVSVREFSVTCKTADTLHGFVSRAAEAFDAWQEGVERFPTAGRITVRPVIELTEGEGFARWPDDLHHLAAMEAMQGWLYAKVQAEARAKFAAAVGSGVSITAEELIAADRSREAVKDEHCRTMGQREADLAQRDELDRAIDQRRGW